MYFELLPKECLEMEALVLHRVAFLVYFKSIIIFHIPYVLCGSAVHNPGDGGVIPWATPIKKDGVLVTDLYNQMNDLC